MAKIRNPIQFSEHYGIDRDRLTELGVFDPTMNADTALFVDPLLLEASRHPEMSQGAWGSYEAHFDIVIRLLAASKVKDDVAWRNALKRLTFPEVKYTCIGYGAGTVSGSGSGAHLRSSYIETAKEVINLGIDDPDLFMALALFEPGVGPDRISDMTCNIIFKDLLDFNTKVLSKLSITTRLFEIRLKNGNTFRERLAENPTFIKPTPVVLLPHDVLRDLPIAKDWDEVADVVAHNEELRAKINDSILELWRSRTLRDKGQLRDWALSNKQHFSTLLEMLRGANPTSYDMVSDPHGEVFWRQLLDKISREDPLKIDCPEVLDKAGALAIVKRIIEQFQFLIEERRFSEELYHQGRPRPEKAAQRLFFAVAHSYCKANDLDLTPEADTGNGPVDFKVSSGYRGRVLVEIKLSTNSKVIAGYSKQLKAYEAAEEAYDAYYIVIDVGRMGDKEDRLLEEKNKSALGKRKAPEIVFVDGIRRQSASKL